MPPDPTDAENILVDPSGQPLAAHPEADMTEYTDGLDAEARRKAVIERQLQRRLEPPEPAAEPELLIVGQVQENLDDRQATLAHYDTAVEPETEEPEDEKEPEPEPEEDEEAVDDFYEEDEDIDSVKAAYETGEHGFTTKQPGGGFSLINMLLRSVRFNVELGSFWFRLIRQLIRPTKLTNDDV